MEQRYYYKTQDERGLLNLKHELTQAEINEHGYISITQEEFEALGVEEISPKTVYFITDTQDLFLGSEQICNLTKTINDRASEISKLAFEKAFEATKDKINAEYKDKYMFLMAEFENYKKRVIAEKDSTVKLANEKIIKSLIAVIDDFDRAVKFITEDSREGFMLIYDKFIKLLENNNVECINPQEGDTFDEGYHEVVAVIPAEREEDKGLIVECNQKGYALSGKVVRYAKVVVMN